MRWRRKKAGSCVRLAELQDSFVQSILHEPEQRLLAVIKADTISAESRLGAYRNNVFNGLFEILKASFPTVVSLVSEDFFRGVVHFYVKEQPPKSACLDEYGGSLPDFLQNYEPAASIPCLADVARFDWLRHATECAVDERAAEARDFEGKNAAGLANLRLRLRALARLMRSDYPLDEIWCLTQAPERREKLHIRKEPRAWLVFRGADPDKWFEAITPASAAALEALEAGQTIQKATLEALAVEERFDLSAFLIKCFRLQVLKAVE